IVEYDAEARALYIRLQRGKVAKTREVSQGVFLDFDSSSNLCGIEILGATARIPSAALSRVVMRAPVAARRLTLVSARRRKEGLQVTRRASAAG
ncbi:MAG: DUF2283 domain-containing protein, partial [Chloroflexota bacterium]